MRPIKTDFGMRCSKCGGDVYTSSWQVDDMNGTWDYSETKCRSCGATDELISDEALRYLLAYGFILGSFGLIAWKIWHG